MSWRSEKTRCLYDTTIKGVQGAKPLAGGAGASPENLPFVYISFSTLKRVVKGHCSCRPLRESIHTTPETVKCKCIREHKRKEKEQEHGREHCHRGRVAPG